MPTVSGIVVATGAKATGRRQFREIIDDLARPVNAGDETIRALAADSFRAAVRTMNRKGLWPWEVQEEDITITANTRRSSVTSPIKKPLAMHLLSSSGGTEDQPVSYQPYDQFLERFSMDYTGEALYYTIPNLYETGEIMWAPIPSATDYARFAYYRVTPAPRNEDEPVEIPDYVTEVYMTEAWVEFIKRCPQARSIINPDLAISMSQRAFREISSHVNAPGDRSRVVSGRLTGV